MALLFVWPWWPEPVPGGEALAQYLPIREASSTTRATYDANGRVTAWESRNVAILPTTASFVRLPSRFVEGIRKMVPDLDLSRLVKNDQLSRLNRVRIAEERFVTVDAEGKTSAMSDVFLRRDPGGEQPGGEFWIGRYYPTSGGEDMVFDPPMRTMPDDLTPGTSPWDSRGSTGGSGGYALHGRVVERGRVDSSLGAFDDCLKVERRFSYTRDGATTRDRVRTGWYCAGIGLVESHVADPSGTPLGRDVVVAADGLAPAGGGLAPARPLRADEPALGDPRDWRAERVGRLFGVSSQAGVFPPVWVPSDPPLLLVAPAWGDLLAFDLSDRSGNVAWHFHVGGTVKGRPAVDLAGGRIYFGAADKRLYALDARGLFLWSFQTGDNVSGQPLVVGETVIFGSEDGKVYGLDAATGVPRWPPKSTGGAVVSSPVLARPRPASGTMPACRLGPSPPATEDLVIVGSDDGTAYALDPESGEQRWAYVTAGPIEAPAAVADGVAYLTSRAGTLSAVDIATGGECWRAVLTSRPDGFGTAPALDEAAVFVVSDDGELYARDRRNGRSLRRPATDAYVGPPVLVGEALLVAGRDGAVHRLGLDGSRQGHWTTRGGAWPPTAVAVGGGVLWLADGYGGVWRVGPVLSGAVALPVAWALDPRLPPLQGLPIMATPARYRERAVVVDAGRDVYLVDPASGAAAHHGRFGQESDGGPLYSLVAGDTLVVASFRELHGVDLRGAAPPWRVAGPGQAIRPPIIAGDIVLWLTYEGELGGRPGPGYLSALDLASGALRWQAPLGDLRVPGGVVVHEGTVYTSTPPAAFALESGERRASIELAGVPYGGPALSESGDTLYVALDAPGSATVVAIDTAAWRERWRARLRESRLEAGEQIWVSGDVLVVPLQSGEVAAVDPAARAERWRYRPPAARGAVTVADGRVWVPLVTGGLRALRADDRLLLARSSHFEVQREVAADPSRRIPPVWRPLLIDDRALVALDRLVAFEVPR